jgi:hypothetical protein
MDGDDERLRPLYRAAWDDRSVRSEIEQAGYDRHAGRVNALLIVCGLAVAALVVILAVTL